MNLYSFRSFRSFQTSIFTDVLFLVQVLVFVNAFQLTAPTGTVSTLSIILDEVTAETGSLSLQVATSVFPQSAAVAVSQNSTDDSPNTDQATGSELSTTQNTTSSTTASTSSKETASQIVAIISTTTVQSTVTWTPSSPETSFVLRPTSASTLLLLSSSTNAPLTTLLTDPDVTVTPSPSPLNSNISESSTISVPVAIGIILAVIAVVIIIIILVRRYLWRSPSSRQQSRRRKQKKNAKRISPFVYAALRPSSWGRRKLEDVEEGFDTEAFVGGHSRNRSAAQQEDGYDSILQRSASVLSSTSEKTCMTYTADHLESDVDYESRVSLPTSVTSNFGSTASQSSDKGKTRSSLDSRKTLGVTNAGLDGEVRESLEPEIAWLQEEMRRFIDDREAGWALEGFQEPIAEEQPPAYV